ncbi:hypothetical protein C8R45DRAFT_1099574 [Mycena sanguinolenta]|nr:hypothetical protein C8R45DRAFT_1099574 [Mycena sanguinolenta]
MRCITSEQPPKNPCARCSKKGLLCEYMAADHDDNSQSPDSAFSDSSWEAPPIPALPLPYTGPPPLNVTPRYYGSEYPDLSLSGSPSNQQKPPTHLTYPTHPTQYYANLEGNSPMSNLGYNPQAAPNYQYMANHGTPGAQPGAYSAANYGSAVNYEQFQ